MVPLQTVVVAVLIVIAGVTFGTTVKTTAELKALAAVKQLALEVTAQVIDAPFVNVDDVNVLFEVGAP